MREAGIHLGSERKTMLEVRIKRRLKILDLHSYSEYCDYLFGQMGLKDELDPSDRCGDHQQDRLLSRAGAL